MEPFIEEAIRLARARMLEKEGGPFGALVVRDGEIIARGWNQVTSTNDPTAHAEIVAIRAACAKLATFRLTGCTLYVNCEPCPMCLAACYWAGIDRIVHAANRDDAAAIGFADAFIYREICLPAPQRILPMAQEGREEALAVFAEWEQLPDKILY
jgi:guanine deaminase